MEFFKIKNLTQIQNLYLTQVYIYFLITKKITFYFIFSENFLQITYKKN